ncbi:hypothetical protein D3C78_1791750 [compost metagenome]
MVDVASQGASHQHASAVADPFANPLDTRRRTPEGEQHAVDGGGQVGHRVHQGAIQVEHHQAWQAPIEQPLQGAHIRPGPARRAWRR